jgi:hypothetical protein
MIDKSIRYFEKGGEAKPIIGIDGEEYDSVEAMQEAMRQDYARRMRETALRGGADEEFVNSDQFNQFLQENPHNAAVAAVVVDDPYGFGSSPVTSQLAKYYTDYLTDTDQLSKIRRFQEGNKDGRLGPGRIFQPFPPPTEAPTDYPILQPVSPTPAPAPAPTPMPTPMPTPSPMPPTPVNPFQRPEAPLATAPQPVNRYSAPPAMQTGPSITPVTDFSFYQAPQQEVALTPAEVLARARNPFNRPT